MTDWDAFQAKTSAIANDFAASEPPAESPDPDPSSTLDPHPEVTAVERILGTIAPDAFGGSYLENGVVRGGVKGAIGSVIGLLQAKLPNVNLIAFNARYSWKELVATSDAITAAMSADSSRTILSAGPDVARNVVAVGVTDTESPVSKALVTQHGGIVSVFRDEPIDLVDDPVAPGRGSPRNPVLGGLDIYSRGRGRSSGFNYGPPIRQDPTGRGVREGRHHRRPLSRRQRAHSRVGAGRTEARRVQPPPLRQRLECRRGHDNDHSRPQHFS